MREIARFQTLDMRVLKRSRAGRQGGFKRGVPDLDLSILFFLLFCCPFSSFVLLCPFLSFFILLCPFLSFWDIPDFSRTFLIFSGIGPIGPFPLSQPSRATYKDRSRKGPRHNQDLSRKKWETPQVGNPQFTLSQNAQLAFRGHTFLSIGRQRVAARFEHARA